jgi:hypothetical protein
MENRKWKMNIMDLWGPFDLAPFDELKAGRTGEKQFLVPGSPSTSSGP